MKKRRPKLYLVRFWIRFVGSGTTVATAMQLGRAGIGIDLSETYLLENAVPRIEAVLAGDGVVGRAATVAIPLGSPPAIRKLRGF